MAHLPFLNRPAARIAGLLYLSLGGCHDAGSDESRDPVQAAARHCRYVIERAIARPDQKDADGVVRRRIATFADPSIVRSANLVHFAWAPGTISEDDGSGSHGGDCTMDITGGQQLVVSAKLDETTLHAGFRF